MSKYVLYVDGGGTPTVRTYFSFKCIGPNKAKYVKMERFWLDNLAPELLPENCSIFNVKGESTNNAAEYCALHYGLLRFMRVIGNSPVAVYQDSQLVVYQVLGQYQCKSEHLKPWLVAIKKIWWDGIDLQWISREKIVEVLGH